MSIKMAARVPMPARMGLGLAAALLAAACGSSASSSSAPPAASGSPSGGASLGSGATTSAPAASGTVITTATAGGGAFLTDGSGRAVYLWVKDSGGKSACDGSCAGAWPPVTATGTPAGKGSVQSADLHMITRSDGTTQVTYFGHPLYYYVGDSGSGQANGQGSDQFGAKWWLVSAMGSGDTSSVSSFTPGSGSASTTPTTPAPATTSKSAGGGWS